MIFHTDGLVEEPVEEVVGLAEVIGVAVTVFSTVTGTAVSVTVAGCECTSQNRASKARLKAQNDDDDIMIYEEKMEGSQKCTEELKY